MERRKRVIWTIIGIICCTFWGISGLCAKALFNLDHSINALWLSQVRMVCAGLFLLGLSVVTSKGPLKVWHSRQSGATVILYALLGIIPVQFCYFEAVQLGNASIATILQFIGPFFILAYQAIFQHQPLERFQMISALVAFLGVVLLATHGHFNELAISGAVLFWGICSAIGDTTTVLAPSTMIRRGFPAMVVTGWGMFIAGLCLMVIHPAFTVMPTGMQAWALIAFVVIFGTILPFQLFSSALRYVPASTAGFLDAFEPLAATIGSVWLFHLQLMPMDWLGSILVVLAVLSLSFVPKKSQIK
ncbi:DMT family transporter [Limosilactobacillus sp.]|uniref:DMT family transporter n=1 Tax=Limosilactobacillus sp. TaxID=2773925 RepID=UPI00345EB036